jgi:hypothetical protein
MADTASTRRSAQAGPHWAPAPPVAALLPGVFMLFAGLWLLDDGGPRVLGWAFFALGSTLSLMGAVAKGVAWGLDLHADRRR